MEVTPAGSKVMFSTWVLPLTSDQSQEHTAITSSCNSIFVGESCFHTNIRTDRGERVTEGEDYVEREVGLRGWGEGGLGEGGGGGVSGGRGSGRIGWDEEGGEWVGAMHTF